MFLLKEVKGNGLHYLLKGKEYIVGRKNVDITISKDASISRKHAIITVNSGTVTLVDCGSKYGTSHNDEKITGNTQVQIKSNDVVKFGVFESLYKLEDMNIVTVTSGLNNNQKNEVKNCISFLGGTLLNDWDSSCTHLTTQEMVLTMKVLLALIDSKVFVTIEYWKKLVDNIKAKLPPPNIDDFKPPLSEIIVEGSKFVVNSQRKTLFQGKTFVFPSARIKSKMEALIEKTGGISVIWDEQPLSPSQVTVSKNTYLFVHSDEVKQLSQSLLDMYQHLKIIGHRTIPVQEIAMAVLNCSCEKDCNPAFNKIEGVFMRDDSNSQSQIFPLAFDTETQRSEIQPKVEMIIPESLDVDTEFIKPKSTVGSTSTKQPFSPVNTIAASSSHNTSKRSNEHHNENAFKKVKLDTSPLETSQRFTSSSKKRRAEENLESLPKKSPLKQNPFAALQNLNVTNKVASANPFLALTVKKETVTNEKSSFMMSVENIKKNLDDEIEIKTPAEEIIHEEIHIKTPVEESDQEEETDHRGTAIKTSISENSSLNESRTSTTSDIKWLSKTSVKLESRDIEEEFKNIFNLFKNTIITESFPVIPRRINISDSIDGSSLNSRKNFKTFRKIRPVCPQVSIINVTIPLHVASKDSGAIMLSDDEDSELPGNPIKKKQTNRFRF